ncbi:MAG: VCBS repeat-containing protein, partial [Acidobacteria bacterium]|nr:VCBS repeat-containing protein [Acidobacteriota bacterium]
MFQLFYQRAIAIIFLMLIPCSVHAVDCDAAKFRGARNFLVGQEPYAVVTADFNQDGKADIAVANNASSFVAVSLGDGTGRLGTPATFGVGPNPRHIVTADFNGDGKADLATANETGLTVTLLLNNGAGGFTLSVYQTGGYPVGLAAADFNGDGRPDLVTANIINDSAAIMLNNGTGGFGSPMTLPSGGSLVKAVAAGDFNSDGKADFALSNQNSNTISLFFGNGAGGFSAPSPVSANNPNNFIAADWNGDGKLDFLVMGTVPTFYPGNGAGGFGSGVTLSGLIGITTMLAVRDVNQDGKNDIIASYNAGLRVGYGAGAGALGPVKDLRVGFLPYGASTADFNLDGRLDLVSVAPAESNASIALNDGAGDFYSAPLVGSSDASVYGPLLTADFDNDGLDDVADMSQTNVRIRYGNGNGGFSAQVLYNALATGNVPDLKAADFNRDGKLDLAIANSNSSSIVLLLNTGSRTFSNPSVMLLDASTGTLAIEDYNRDGKLDLAVALANTGSVRVFFGNGDGTFLASPTTVLIPGSPFQVFNGDFNHDGKTDLLTVNADHSISVAPGNGAGGFAQPNTYANVVNTFSSQSVVVGDFNRDGFDDLAVSPDTSYSLKLLLNNGTGGFLPPRTIYAGVQTANLIAADFNHDRKLDLAVQSFRETSILIGDGTGGFCSAGDYSTEQSGLLTVGDYNQDGRTDVIVGHSLRLLLNLTPFSRAPETTDFDGDGLTDLSVFRPGAGYWYILNSADNSFRAIPFGTNGDLPVAADYDGDGKTDVAVFRPSNGFWYYLRSSDGQFAYQQFGQSGDVPVQGDYDGDGRTNFAVWRPSTGTWYTSLDPATNYGAVVWGDSTDIPVPADYD